ncbi:MAG TPA: hypothetical protein VHE10_00800 [Candidatus Paceibacterota bacterium]|nr:hypothetical protein [Candidatus Paceibacterota bacterium]
MNSYKKNIYIKRQAMAVFTAMLTGYGASMAAHTFLSLVLPENLSFSLSLFAMIPFYLAMVKVTSRDKARAEKDGII